jgi:DNA-binding XRE family transcriptional regulator
MMFNERIKQLREYRQLPQRKLATTLDIDIATYCKIEKGERRVKAEQVAAVVDDELKMADKALKIAKGNLRSK